MTKKISAKMAKQNAMFQEIYEKADKEAEKAGKEAVPTPMGVFEADPVSGEKTPGGKSYYVSEGMCGFAWVSLKGNTAFGKWLIKNDLASVGYPSGLKISMNYGMTQSIERKEASARAFAKVLNDNGIKCYSDSRLD